MLGVPVILWSLAMASQVAYRPVSLEQLVGRSDLVVVVTPADPFVTTSTVQGLERRDHHVVVVEALLGFASAGESLTVTPANFRKQVAMHEAYKRGVSRSPIYDRFEEGPDSAEGRRIAFLRYDTNLLVWSVLDAYTKDTATVREAVAKRRPTSWNDELDLAISDVAVSAGVPEPGGGAARVARVLRSQPDLCWVVHGGANPEDGSSEARWFISQLVSHGVSAERLATGVLREDRPAARSSDGRLALGWALPGEEWTATARCPRSR